VEKRPTIKDEDVAEVKKFLESSGLPTTGYLTILKNFHKNKMATYNIKTGKEEKNFSFGNYAVSFQVNKEPGIRRDYTDDEYDLYVYECVYRSGSVPYIGYFDNPEISFVTSDFAVAWNMMIDYNQFSIHAFKYSVETGEDIINELYDSKHNPIKE